MECARPSLSTEPPIPATDPKLTQRPRIIRRQPVIDRQMSGLAADDTSATDHYSIQSDLEAN